MYTNTNFATKKALKEAVANGVRVGIHQPGSFGGDEPRDGRVALEGPWFPEPHRWYATAQIENGAIKKVS